MRINFSDFSTKTYVVVNISHQQLFLASKTNVKLMEKEFFCSCFVALRPKSTAMVMAGRSVHLTTLFPGQA